jgi:ABC-2 type transport system permease protein
MLKLCWKDFYITRLFLIPVPFFFVILLNIFVFSEFLFFTAGILLTFIMVISIPLMEDKYRTEQIMLSLPVTKQSIVLSRYVSSFFISGIGMILYFVSGSLYSSIFKDKIVSLKFVIGLEGGAVFLFVSFLLTALFLPFYFKLGISKALLFFPAFMAVLSAVIWLGIESISLNLQTLLNTPLLLFLLFLLFSSLTLVSISLSIKAYKLKEL